MYGHNYSLSFKVAKILHINIKTNKNAFNRLF